MVKATLTLLLDDVEVFDVNVLIDGSDVYELDTAILFQKYLGRALTDPSDRPIASPGKLVTVTRTERSTALAVPDVLDPAPEPGTKGKQ